MGRIQREIYPIRSLPEFQLAFKNAHIKDIQVIPSNDLHHTVFINSAPNTASYSVENGDLFKFLMEK